MQLRKLSVVLLALLLAAMAMVPMVNAAGDPKEIQSGIKTSVDNLIPGNDMFSYLSIEKLVQASGPAWQKYDSSKKEVDDLIARSGKERDAKTVIGYLKGDSEKVVLYRNADGNYYALLQKDGTIVTKAASVAVLGSKEDKPVELISPGIAHDVNNKSYSATRYEIRKISLSNIGSSEFGSRAVYSTQVRRTDSWVSAGGKRADLYTDGTFTYDYGNQILSIADNTYSTQGFGIDRLRFLSFNPRNRKYRICRIQCGLGADISNATETFSRCVDKL